MGFQSSATLTDEFHLVGDHFKLEPHLLRRLIGCNCTVTSMIDTVKSGYASLICGNKMCCMKCDARSSPNFIFNTE